MPHRPLAEMFSKRALIITQCLGSGAKSTAKDIKHSLSWWGISKIDTCCSSLISDIIWNKLSIRKQKSLTNRIKKVAYKFKRIEYNKPAHTTLITKLKFFFCRLIQKKVLKNGVGGLDNKYWIENGWLEKSRPWKASKKK